jgi:chromosome segregation ATPase
MAQPQSSSGILDLVQLRWQFIRSVDSTQSIQKENIELKQEIAQLKLKLKNVVNEKSGVKSEIVDKFKMHLDSYIMRDKKELIRLRQYVQSEQEESNNVRILLQRAVQQYQTLLVEKERRVDELKAEYAGSAKEIAHLKKELIHQQSKHEEESKKLKHLAESQKEEIERLNGVIIKHVEELKALTAQNEELNTKYSSFGKMLAVCNVFAKKSFKSKQFLCCRTWKSKTQL